MAIVEEARDLAASGGGVVPPDVGPIAARRHRPPAVLRLAALGKARSAPTRRKSRGPRSPIRTRSTRSAFGTFVHAALARIDLSGKQPIAAALRTNRLRACPAKCGSRRRTRRPNCSSGSAHPARWSHIAAAKTVHRELEFLLAWPPDGTTGDGRYLQGFFDCVYQDASGGWHLVDYKTNNISAAEVAAERRQVRNADAASTHWPLERALGTAAGRGRAPLPPAGRRACVRVERRQPAGERIQMVDAAMRRTGPERCLIQLPNATSPSTWCKSSAPPASRPCGRAAASATNCSAIAPKDYDVATSAKPDEIRDIFGHNRTLAIGVSFGVITVLGRRHQGQIEVATFRTDAEYSDGRHPDSVHFTTAEHDAERRDFTINGLFFDPVAEEVVDYVGGRDDLDRETDPRDRRSALAASPKTSSACSAPSASPPRSTSRSNPRRSPPSRRWPQR